MWFDLSCSVELSFSQFTYQLGMLCFAEYVFCFSRINAESMIIHRDTGYITVDSQKFDWDELIVSMLFFFVYSDFLLSLCVLAFLFCLYFVIDFLPFCA